MWTGTESSHVVGNDVTSFTIEGLQEITAYRVSVSALVGSRELASSTLNVKTGTTPPVLPKLTPAGAF